jgi:hypothetical protein
MATEGRLPKSQMLVFHGDFDKWLSFCDLAVVAVHDNGALNGAQKL